MRYIAFISIIAFIFPTAWAQPTGKWANLDRYPDCSVALNFSPNGKVSVPDPKNPSSLLDATWKLQGATLIINDKQNDWESYYDYKGDVIIWRSVKALGKTQDISNQFSQSDRTLKACQ